MSLLDRRAALAAALAFAMVSPSVASGHAGPSNTVEIDTSQGVRTFTVEVVADDASRERGLMYRRSLAADRGMLFEFPKAELQTFWMRNTFIPLDIIYIGADGRIVSIAADARPMDETPLPSRRPAKTVLEINGGLAAKLGIRPGDVVRRVASEKR